MLKELINLKLFITLCFSLLLSACSTQIYQAMGKYEDGSGIDRRVLIQWKAQKYYIPLVSPEIDYGSVSFQAECIQDVFLDHDNHTEFGLIFKERAQEFRRIENAPIINVGNYIVCAKLKNNESLSDIKVGDDVKLEVLCEAKSTLTPMLQANLDGYQLKTSEVDTELVLGCPTKVVPMASE